MKQYLALDTLSYNVLGDFIESAVQQRKDEALFLLGKAAAYIDAAFSLDLLTFSESNELLICIQIYQDGI